MYNVSFGRGGRAGAAIPAAPTGFSAVPGNTSVALTWNAHSAETRVYRGGVLVQAAAAGSTGWTDTGRTSAVTYAYRIAAYRAGRASALSDEATATPYTATGSTYGGTAYASRTGDLTGLADAKTGTFLAWVRFDGGNGVLQRILHIRDNASGRLVVYRSTGNAFAVVGRNAAGTTILQLDANVLATAGATWYHLGVTWNLATGVGQLYVNGADARGPGAVLTNDTIDYASDAPGVFVGASPAGGDKINASLSEVFFDTPHTDLSSTPNMRKFRRADGRPAAIRSAAGVWLVGAQPLLYAPDGNPATNLGTGGAFPSITGTITAASTSPSD